MKLSIIGLLIALFCNVAFSATNFKFKKQVGEISFKTKGWPNLVTIKGQGKGIEGLLKEEKGFVSGDVAFDLSTLKTGIALRDEHMKNKYLQVDQFPTARLILKDLKIPDSKSGEFKFKGTMDLHGVKKEVEGIATLKNQNESLVLQAAFPILLEEYAIEIPNYKGITVANKVDVVLKTQIDNQ